MQSKEVNCIACDAIIDKDEIALNKKINGRTVKKFLCLSCFADYLNITVDELQDKIQDFKDQGCTLFN